MQAMELIETCLIGMLACTPEHPLPDHPRAEYEMMDYSVSSLVAAALLESLHICELHQQCNAHSGGHWDDQEELAEEKPPIARVCAGCVNQEICDALQVPRVRIYLCYCASNLYLALTF